MATTRGYFNPKAPDNTYRRVLTRLSGGRISREPTWVMYDFFVKMPFFAEWMAFSAGMVVGDWLNWQFTLAVTIAYFIGGLRGHVLWTSRN